MILILKLSSSHHFVGTKLKILKYPHPQLRTDNEEISEFDENLKKLANEMLLVMRAADGTVILLHSYFPHLIVILVLFFLSCCRHWIGSSTGGYQQALNGLQRKG